MSGEEGESEKQMSVRGLKVDTKDYEGDESETQRERKDQNRGARREESKLVPAPKLNFKRRQERQKS